MRSPASSRRGLERHCGPGATDATCDVDALPAVAEDTSTAVPANNFAVRDFQLFECGSNLRPCLGEIVAGAPIAALCSNVAADAAHSCELRACPMTAT